MWCRDATVGKRARVVLVAVVLGVLVLPSVATAHARLVRSSPADGTGLTEAPKQLSLCFNELLDRQFHAIELDAEPGSAGRPSSQPAQLTPSVDPQERTCLLAALPPLVPGAYVVRWRVVSRDGHATRGLIRFRVG